MATQTLLTVEQYHSLPDDDSVERELLNGRLIEMAKPQMEHGFVQMGIGTVLNVHVRSHDLPFLVGGECEFDLDGETSVAPDVFLIRRDRATTMSRRGSTVIGCPDLAVEVVSPNDRALDLHEKTEAYLRAGAHAVWVIYHEARHILVRRRSSKSAEQLGPGDVLEEPDLLPGFRVPVEDVFANIPTRPKHE